MITDPTLADFDIEQYANDTSPACNDDSTVRAMAKELLKHRLHAKLAANWNGSAEDAERLASLYTHDLALPYSTNGEVVLGQALTQLAARIRGLEDLSLIGLLKRIGAMLLFDYRAENKAALLIEIERLLPDPDPRKHAGRGNGCTRCDLDLNVFPRPHLALNEEEITCQTCLVKYIEEQDDRLAHTTAGRARAVELLRKLQEGGTTS